MTTQYARTPLWEHQHKTQAAFDEQARVICGWDMGTGKTLFGINRDMWLRSIGEVRHTLIIAPLNTHDQWAEAVAYESGGQLVARTIDRKNRHLFWDGGKSHVYIMHWQVVRLMWNELQGMFDHVICDEVHAIKSRKAKVTTATKRLKIKFITDMSGSPVTDRPSDFWSILNHVKPRTWSSYWKFVDQYVEQEITHAGQGRTFKKLGGPKDIWLSEGLDLIAPYYSRVEAQDVLDTLPPKTYTKRYVELAPPQRKAYQQMSDEMLVWLTSIDGELEPLMAGAVIAKLQRLQQFALAMMEWNGETEKWQMSMPSPKVDLFMEMLEDTGDTPFVLFSQFKGPLALTASQLQDRGIPYSLFTGDQTTAMKRDAKARFVNGESRVFMATIASAGEGIDKLQTNCHNMVFYDRDWSPMRNAQAEARLWRGNQLMPVNITDIMAKDTIDFARATQIAIKKEWVMKTLGGKYD